jgi:hypothetical protein
MRIPIKQLIAMPIKATLIPAMTDRVSDIPRHCMIAAVASPTDVALAISAPMPEAIPCPRIILTSSHKVNSKRGATLRPKERLERKVNIYISIYERLVKWGMLP